MVTFHQGGLSSGWSFIMVTFHRGGLSLWSLFIRVVFHRGFRCIVQADLWFQSGEPVRKVIDRCQLLLDKGKVVDPVTDRRLDFHFNALLDVLAQWRKSGQPDVCLSGSVRCVNVCVCKRVCVKCVCVCVNVCV